MKEIKDIIQRCYGMDSLSIALLLSSALFNLPVLIHPKGICLWFVVPAVALLILCIFRFFSGNHAKRWEENLIFLRMIEPVFQKDKEQEEEKQNKKNLRYFDCPACKLQICVPKGKGRIEITCPKCKKRFIRKT